MLTPPPAPLALMLDTDALKSNWRWLSMQSHGAQCGAAVKANAYGLGAATVARTLSAIGCRNFFVATWAEALEVKPHIGDAGLSVLHGVRPEDMEVALALGAKPVLNSPEQIARWREAGGGECDVMIDTGMNRLGIDPNDVTRDMFAGLDIDIVMSHLACADDDHPLNTVQPMIFGQMARKAGAKRKSLANSAGIMLGESYCYEVTRPGLSLYGGLPRAEGAGYINQVVRPRAQIIQRRVVRGGESVGYGATWTANRQRDAAILHVGYGDGYFRGFSNEGMVMSGEGQTFPVIGRVSMDLIAVDVSERPSLAEGEWLELSFSLSEAAIRSGMSQYELLTSLGSRYDRVWI